jgi:hypothetical protein
LSPRHRQEIRALAEELPAVWGAASTTRQERQQVVRLLLERVVVEVVGESEQVRVALHWQGGAISEHLFVRPVDGYAQLSYFPQLRERIIALRAAGVACEAIAQQLNAEGFRPPKRTEHFTGAMVAHFLGRQGRGGPRPDAAAAGGLAADEWRLGDLARHLEMPLTTLHRWRKAGWVQARKAPLAGGRWVLWADAEEVERLRKLRACPRSWAARPHRAQLVVPKPRPGRERKE